MPVLENPRHEAFAQARAKGVRLEQAYEDAGFAPGNGHAGRLSVRLDIAERIAELRAMQTDLEGASAQAVIAALLRVAKLSDAAASPAALKEIRLTLLEVDRLRALAEEGRRTDRIAIARCQQTQ